MKPQYLIFTLLPLFLLSCQEEENGADAYGNFEATEIWVPAEANGKILQLEVEEGEELQADQWVGLIDTTNLHLQRMQLLASMGSVRQKTQTADPEVEVLLEQKRNLEREQKRLKSLVENNAATPKQLDDIEGQIEVVEQQIRSTRNQINTVNRGILAELDPIEAQIRVLEHQIDKSHIINPIKGTVLQKTMEAHEFAAMGRPLYKIADLGVMTLRAYISGAQLPHVQIGQEVKVLIDQDEQSNRTLRGKVSWISDQAEFTPKMIQTKEERVHLVYAIKVEVPNDGRLKIGMPGEVLFNHAQASEETSSSATVK
jgi:HlyD family secretion protein